MNKTTNKKKLDSSIKHILSELRSLIGLSQSKLGKEIGLKQSHMSACELGRRKMSVEAFMRLIKFTYDSGVKKKDIVDVLLD